MKLWNPTVSKTPRRQNAPAAKAKSATQKRSSRDIIFSIFGPVRTIKVKQRIGICPRTAKGACRSNMIHSKVCVLELCLTITISFCSREAGLL